MPTKRKSTSPMRRQLSQLHKHKQKQKQKQDIQNKKSRQIMYGGSAESSATDSSVCSADINRLLIGNPPVIHKSGQDSSFAKMASGLSKTGSEFKKQFSGSIGNNPGKPPALPDGCTIL